jgi:hypothetical protein
MKRTFVALLAMAATIVLVNQASATILVTPAGSNSEFTLTHDALGESATITGITTQFPKLEQLQDNALGSPNYNGKEEDYANFVYPNDHFTYTFNTTTNTAGYDITTIATYAGWYDGLRSNQGYQIDLTYVSGSTATLLSKQTLNANTSANVWTEVALTNQEGGVLSQNGVAATGVKAITFRNFDVSTADPNVWQQVMYREVNIVGNATATPEPGTLVLLGTMLTGILAYAWRKRK